MDLERFIVDNVIEPALKATCENKLQFAVAVGKTFFDIFEKIKNGQIDGAEASLLGQWCCEKTKGKGRNLKGLMNMISDDSLSKVWPRNKGELTIRSYHLYEVRINNIVARILVTYASGGNTPPSKKFRDVEAKIRKFARECGDTNMRDALAVIKESTMATLQKRDTLELYDFGHEGKTEVTPDKKREIAYKLLKPWPEKHPKHNGNDSHLCYFTGDSRPEAVVLSVKYADRGGSVPGIGFYWNGGGKFNYLDSLKHLRLPEGFRLNEKAINPTTDKGWVSFYKEGCTSAAEMFCQIVDPGTYLEQWGELFKMLMDWAEGNGIGLPQFHTQEKGRLC